MRFLICVRPFVLSSSVLSFGRVRTLWYVGFFTRFPNLRSSGSDGGNMCPSVNNLLRASNTSFLSSSASPFTQVSDGWWPKDLVKLLPYISCSFIHTQLALNLFSFSCMFFSHRLRPSLSENPLSHRFISVCFRRTLEGSGLAFAIWLVTSQSGETFFAIPLVPSRL